jgi:guanosine-3',5'-bis(diphosphate) 3'-pyrophosphohydrolase
VENSPVPLITALDFAAQRHGDHRRKNAAQSPYVNHLIAVLRILVEEGGVTDETMLVAACLHDTVEDTDTTFDELRAQFGNEVEGLVREMTDDKTLPKAERKRLQIVHAPGASPAAKQLKLADKIANLRDIIASPPTNWPLERKLDYLEWAEQVIAGCRGVNERLEAVFDDVVRQGRERLG